MALNTFTMQDKMHVIIFVNLKSKPRDISVVESPYGYNLLSMDFFPEGIINGKSRNSSEIFWNIVKIKMVHKNLEYRLSPRESNHGTYALMTEFSRSPQENKTSCNIQKGEFYTLITHKNPCKCEKNFQYQCLRHCIFFLKKIH